jgi:hypothetical protein
MSMTDLYIGRFTRTEVASTLRRGRAAEIVVQPAYGLVLLETLLCEAGTERQRNGEWWALSHRGGKVPAWTR